MLRNLIRLAPLLALLSLFDINRVLVLHQKMFNVKFQQNKALYGHSFVNITNTDMAGCLGKCLENCLCQSFQLCNETECQLCSSKHELSPSSLRERQGCMYYDFESDLSEFRSMQQCDQSLDETCPAHVNCCTKCNPCYNSGSCWPAVNTPCNRCTCPPGFTGNLCQHPITSCRSYADGSRVPGNYDVLDAEMKPYEVFCDFELNSSMTWTLIQSYQLKNVEKFRNSFFINTPINSRTPSWEAYRLSRNRMEMIRDDSTKWRMTCQYEVSSRKREFYIDYVRGANEEIDILTYDDAQCVKLEYLNIRGKGSYDCTAFVLQSHTLNHTNYLYPLHIDTRTWRSAYGCTFGRHGELCTNSNDGAEDNFGYYHCVNSKHRCSATKNATSQTWFGA